jgi:hypothetical protein
MKQIYTQMIDPNKNIWIPCLESRAVDHTPVTTDAVLITHFNAIEYYNGKLLDKKIYCIGPKTQDRLLKSGFEDVVCLGLKASEAVIPDEPITWLHADSYARDFGSEHNVQALQVYEISVNLLNVEIALNIYPDRVWIYSQRVIEAFERTCRTDTIELMCTDSCKPNFTVWFNITSFYPS